MEGIPGYDPNNLQPWTVKTVASVTVLAVLSVILRLYSRHSKQQTIGADDYMIIFSMLWNLVVVGFIFAMYGEGMGLHANNPNVSPENIVMMAKYLLVAEILYVYNLVWTKIGVLLMYYRIFHTAYFRRWALVIASFCIAWVICITFLFIFICIPVEKLWYPDVPGRCINQVATWIANAVSTILTDVAILLLPMPQVWRLNMRIGEKIAVTLAFSLGFFVVFTSAYRFSVLFSYTAADPSYTLAPTVGWTAIEMSTGIVSANLPTLLPVVRRCIRFLGLNRALDTLFSGHTDGRTGSGRASRTPHRRGRNTDQASDTAKLEPHSRQNSDFHRLSEDEISHDSQDGDDGRKVLKLRPQDKSPYAVHTTSVSSPRRGRHDDTSDDDGNDIRLQEIRVTSQIKQTSSSKR